MTTANINGATIDIEGTIEFNDLDILPGHKTISGIKLTATGNNELIPYNLIWEGTNTINTALRYTVYKTNIEDKGLSTYIDTNTGFCNDREIDKTAHSSYIGDGYGTQQSGYAPWGRLMANSNWKTTQTPTLKCANKSRDLFTHTSANGGNKKLIYPIGLITSDEVIFAGGFGDTRNSVYYLYTYQNYWTMSTRNCNGGDANLFCLYSNGGLNNWVVSNALGL